MKKVFFWALPLLIASCSQQAKDVVVRVDGSVLTKARFEKYISEAEYKKLTDDQLKDFCEKWAEQEMIYLEAKKKGIDREDSIKTVLEEYKKSLVAMALVRREFGGGSVTEQEALDYFNAHKNEFLYAVKLGQIFLSSADAAQATLAEIRAGADFFKLARERSLTRYENPDSPRVVTDYLSRGKIADFDIEETIFSLKPGEVSDVIPWQGAYLIVKMIDKKQVLAKVDYAQYSAAIHNYLLQRKSQEFLQHYVDSLKTRYKININLAPLKS